MNDRSEGVCFDCAMRLGKNTFPDIPELLDGFCPQCGGTRALETLTAQQPPRSKESATVNRQAA